MFLLFTVLLTAHANIAYSSTTLDEFYHTHHQKDKKDLLSDFMSISDRFLGCEYVFDPLAEGISAKSFDCVTFVDTVMALLYAKDDKHFERTWQKLRYQGKGVSYLQRNHIVELHWLKRQNLKPWQPACCSHQEKAFIDEGGFYTQLCLRKGVSDADCQPYQQRSGKWVTLPVIGFEELSRLHYSDFPDLSLVLVTRHDWPKEKAGLGTQLLVSHLGFVYRKDGQLRFRQASSVLKKVVDVNFQEYINDYYAGSLTISGFSFYRLS